MRSTHVRPKGTSYGDLQVARNLTADYFVVACMVFGAGLVLLRDYLLPKQFGSDSPVIQAIALGRMTGDPSYTNVATVYAALGLADSPTAAALIGYGTALVPLVIVWRRKRSVPLNWVSRIHIFALTMLSAVYLGTYSKDVLVVPVVALLLLAPCSSFGMILTFASALGYGLIFRQYWILVAFLFVALGFVVRRARGARLLLWGAVAAAAVSLAVALYAGGDADAFRDRTNEYRTVDDARTMIVPLMQASGVAPSVLNNVVTYFALILPVPLMLIGTYYHLAASGLVATIWYGFFRQRGSGHPVATGDRREVWCISLVMALLVTQSAFEPDYGSALRHLTPLLPLVLSISWASPSRGVGSLSGPGCVTGAKSAWADAAPRSRSSATSGRPTGQDRPGVSGDSVH